MLSWQELSQQLHQSVNTFIRIVKARRREEAAIGIAAILFWIGDSFFNWLPKVVQDWVESWRGNLIIPIIFYVAGLLFLLYGVYRIWQLVFTPDLPPVANRPSAIKGPLAFTPADGELFRKLGREDELRKLLGYIEDSQVRLIVLMGASGAGKTSLLRAGLTDILKDKEIAYHYWEAVPTGSGRALLRAIQENWRPATSAEVGEQNGPVPVVELKSLEDLVNPSSALGDGKHVIVLDQFEQLRGAKNGPVFRLLRKVAREAEPPHQVTWIVAFRREFRADWSDFVIPEHERGFFPPLLSLRLFTAEQARDVISQLVSAAGLKVEQKVVDNLIAAATVEGEVSSVDIGIGLLVLSELHERQGGKTVTEDVYHFAGGAEGLLTQYISKCLDGFSDEDRRAIFNAMLSLLDPETNQRLAGGKTCAELAEETKADSRRLRTQLDRLTQRDMRLLEPVARPDGGDTRYRLPHERLIPALNRLAGKLLAEVEQAKLKLVNAFSAWRNSSGASQYLLRGRDLRLVERYRGRIPWGADEAEKLKFLKRSRRQRATRRLTLIAGIVGLVAAGWVAGTQIQIYEAKKVLRDNQYPPELYDWLRTQPLKALELNTPFNGTRLPLLRSDTLEEFSIKVTATTNSLDGLEASLTGCPALKNLNLDLSDKVSDLKPLAELKNLTQLTLDLNSSKVSDLEPLMMLNDCQSLTLNLTSDQRLSLKAIPKSVTRLKF